MVRTNAAKPLAIMAFAALPKRRLTSEKKQVRLPAGQKTKAKEILWDQE
jgi:hypothetical protein